MADQRMQHPWPDEDSNRKLGDLQKQQTLRQKAFPFQGVTQAVQQANQLSQQLKSGAQTSTQQNHYTNQPPTAPLPAPPSTPAEPMTAQAQHRLSPSYNLSTELQQRQKRQEQAALSHMQVQLTGVANLWKKKWSEHHEATSNTRLLFARILNELPGFCDSLNKLLQPALVEADPTSNPYTPPPLHWRIDNDRSVGIMDFMGLTLSFLVCDTPHPLELPRTGRPSLICGRIIALNGDLLDAHGPLYSSDMTDWTNFELASLYVSADANAPIIMRLLAEKPSSSAEEVFFYTQLAPRAFLTKLLERLGQCPQLHETAL